MHVLDDTLHLGVHAAWRCNAYPFSESSGPVCYHYWWRTVCVTLYAVDAARLIPDCYPGSVSLSNVANPAFGLDLQTQYTCTAQATR